MRRPVVYVNRCRVKTNSLIIVYEKCKWLNDSWKKNISKPPPPPSTGLGLTKSKSVGIQSAGVHTCGGRMPASERIEGERDSENNRISSLPPPGNIAMRARAIGERIAAGTMTISAVARSVLGRSLPSQPPPLTAHGSPRPGPPHLVAFSRPPLRPRLRFARVPPAGVRRVAIALRQYARTRARPTYGPTVGGDVWNLRGGCKFVFGTSDSRTPLNRGRRTTRRRPKEVTRKHR